MQVNALTMLTGGITTFAIITAFCMTEGEPVLPSVEAASFTVNDISHCQLSPDHDTLRLYFANQNGDKHQMTSSLMTSDRNPNRINFEFPGQIVAQFNITNNTCWALSPLDTQHNIHGLIATMRYD